MSDLTPDEVATAHELGIPLREYAHLKRKLEIAKEEFRQWLQTPAGVEYMREKEKNIADLEKKLQRPEKSSCH